MSIAFEGLYLCHARCACRVIKNNYLVTGNSSATGDRKGYICKHHKLAELSMFQCASATGSCRALTVESSTNTPAFGTYIPIYGHKVLEESASSAANQEMPHV